MPDDLKRISLVVREDQHDRLQKAGVNVSGFVRDLLDDYFSEHTITLSVSQETRELYSKIISNTGSDDQALEKYFKQAMKEMLEEKIAEMDALRKTLDRS